jgi:hypothetical protein
MFFAALNMDYPTYIGKMTRHQSAEVEIIERSSVIAQDKIQPANLKYKHEFTPQDLDGANACLSAHGFAVIKRVIPDSFVQELRHAIDASLNPNNDLEPGRGRTGHAFMEICPTILKFLEHETWFNIIKYFEGTDQLRFRRSAAIIRNPGAPCVNWHTDWSFWTGLYKRPPRNINDALNVTEGLGGRWFYLEGTHPLRAGLAVIENSHTLDWQAPEGFEFTDDRSTFYKKGTTPKAYEGWDVPCIVPLFTDPGDMILWTARTYHYAFPHNGTEPRHSCGGPGLVAKSKPIYAPWPISQRTQRFIDSLPPKYTPYADGYRGYDDTWKFNPADFPQHQPQTM